MAQFKFTLYKYITLKDGACLIVKLMLSSKVKIRLIHEHRSTLLERMFDELCRKAPGRSAEQVEQDIIVAARVIQEAYSNCDQIQHPPRGLFVLAFQQAVDSFIGGLRTEEAFEWLAGAIAITSHKPTYQA